MELIMTIGLPGCGKSTLGKEYEQKGYTVASSDGIRAEYNFNIENKDVFSKMRERTIDSLSNGKSVYYDATNMSAKLRSNTIMEIKKRFPNLIVKAFLWVTPIEICKARNATRQGVYRVPDEVYIKMLKQFNMPMSWEGFDVIEWQDKEVRTKSVTEYITEMKDFPQENKWHIKYDNLLEHCEKVTEMFTRDLITAFPNHSIDCKSVGMFHDIGKLITKSYSSDGNAHFFNHENVGAYLYISSKDISEKDSTTAQLINYHMIPFKWLHKRDVWETRFGKNFAKVLEIFNKADRTEC